MTRPWLEEHRWAPGQSPNPGGRPYRKPLTDQYRRRLDEEFLEGSELDELLKSMQVEVPRSWYDRKIGEVLADMWREPQPWGTQTCPGRGGSIVKGHAEPAARLPQFRWNVASDRDAMETASGLVEA